MQKGNIILNFYKKLEPFYNLPYRYFYNSDYFLGVLAEYDEVPHEEMDRESILALLVNKVYFNPLLDSQIIAKYNLSLLKKIVAEDPIPHIDWNRVQEILIHLNIECDKEELGILFDFEHSWFGEDSSIYFNQVNNFKREFPLMTDNDYYEYKLKLNDTLLKKESIYNTEYFRQKYEKKARFNLITEMKMLNPSLIVSK